MLTKSKQDKVERSQQRDTDKKSLKQKDTKEYKIGFNGESPSFEIENELADQVKQNQRQGGNNYSNRMEIEMAQTAARAGRREE